MKQLVQFKRIFAAVLLLTVSTLTWAYNFSVDGIYYNINTDGTSVSVTYKTTSDRGYSGSVVIPSTVTYNDTEYSVKSIRGSAFRGCSGLTSVTIGNSVTSIGSSAFYGCTGLTSITIPNSVTSIGSSAFSGCSGLTSVTIPNSVTSIGSSAFEGTAWFNNQPDGLVYAGKVAYKYKGTMPTGTHITLEEGTLGITDRAFYNCSGLTSVSIPNSVTSIGNSAFYGCSGLTSVTLNANDIVSKTYSYSSNLGTIFGTQVKEYVLGDDVKGIGNYAFYKCSGLTSVTIPNSVTSIGGYVFCGCSSLTSIVIDKDNTYYDSRDNCNAIIQTSSNTLISGCKSTVIPNSVTSIGNYAFYNCSGLTSITIPNSVTSIGQDAFSGCSGLAKADFASIESLCKIEFGSSYANPLCYAKHLYINGQEITDLVIPESVTSIGYAAFCSCDNLTSITIPNSVTSIGSSAFSGCSGLISITIPNSVTSIGNNAFYNCTGLTSITIPNSVTSIGNWAFYGCSGLTKAEFASIESLCKISFGGADANPLYYAKHLYINGQEITDLVIPESVTSIGAYVFCGCSGLTSVTIPNSVTSIGGYAFYGCSGLNSITIPNSVTSIGEGAFYNTAWYNNQPDGLIYAGKVAYKYKGTMPEGTEIVIKDGTLEIAKFAFYYCSGLTSITIPESVTSIGESAFEYCSGLTSVTIPNSVTSIGESAFSGCSGLTKAEFASIESLFKIKFEDYDSNPLYYAHHLYINGQEVTDLVIPGSVTSIGYRAFFGCTGLTSVTILEGVTSIGYNAFYNCSGLTSITIPESVTSIGDNAFYGCSSLTKAEFASIESLCKIEFGHIGTTYAANPLFYAKHLYINGQEVTDLVIPESVTTIGEFAFYGCSGLTSITIPSSVTYISGWAFNGCSGLTSVNIPSSVTGIGYYAFQNCSGLTSITIPNSVTRIGRYAFDGTAWYNNQPDGLVYAGQVAYKYKGTMPEGLEIVIKDGTLVIADNAFYGCTGLTSITIPNSVTSIGDDAFRKCSSLTSVTIPNSVTSIGYSAFEGCSGLTSVTIPNSVTAIYYTFEGCSGLTSVTIPNSVTAIHYAFASCSALKEVYCLAEQVPYTSSAFEYTDIENAILYVPTSAIDDYRSTAPWSGFGTILALEPVSILGDANGNGEVEIGDVTSVLTLMATPEATGYDNKAADANQNGVIEIGDVTTILTIMANGE